LLPAANVSTFVPRKSFLFDPARLGAALALAHVASLFEPTPREEKPPFAQERELAQPSVEIGGLVLSSASATRGLASCVSIKRHTGKVAVRTLLELVLIGAGSRVPTPIDEPYY
jgi:hypothetical protein